MPIITGNTTLSANSTNDFVVTNGSNTAMMVKPHGGFPAVTSPKNPYFVAGWNGTVAWITMPTGWNRVPFNVVNQQGTGFDIVNSVYYPPITGYYYFCANTYLNKVAGDALSYCHPNFHVNGSGTLRRPYSNLSYRMRGRSLPVGTSVDASMEETIYLQVGDYVEFVISPNAANVMQYYRTYNYFAGYFVG